MIRVSVNNESLNRLGRTIEKKVRLAQSKIVQGLESDMRSAAQDAHNNSMVATGQTRDNTKYFGKHEGANKIRLAMGIERGGNEQELFTEGLSNHTGGGKVHTSINQHVKAKCSRSILGSNAGNPSFYSANPNAKSRALFSAINKFFGFYVTTHGLRRGSVNRYVPVLGIKNSKMWKSVRKNFKAVFRG